jgi:pyridoxine kinase
VIGDVGHGVYVRPGIAEFMRDTALPAADVATPNLFELEQLTGIAVRSLADARRAIAALHAMGPRAILVTSLIHPGTREDEIELLASVDGRAWLATTPRLALSVSGAGDAIAALFFAHYARTRAGDVALARAASSIYGLLRRTHAAGTAEIRLVDAQDEFVHPSHAVAVRALD